MHRIANKLKDKYTVSVLANILSYGLVGGVGILINVAIVTLYDTTALGYFNQVFSFYIILSQLAVGGIHLSTQFFTTHYLTDKGNRDQILAAGLVLSCILAMAVAAMLYAGRFVPEYVLKSENISTGLVLIIPGLIFFPINKVALAYLNGKRHMLSFAFFQAFRAVVVIVFMALLYVGDFGSLYIPAILSCGEFVLMVCILFYIRRSLGALFRFGSYRDWIVKHFHYGRKAMIGNLLLDINSRVDILILGIFFSDSIVGVYSFAANIADGFNQIPYVLRNMINPVITLCHVKKNMPLLQRIIHRAKRLYYKILIPSSVLVVAGYAAAIYLLKLDQELAASIPALAILMAGMALSSGYLPFQLIFNQTGHPGAQSLLLLILCTMNVVLNFALVPLLGMQGSATATALTFVLHIVALRRMARARLGIEI